MNWKPICQILLFTLISAEIFGQLSENRDHLICESNSFSSLKTADIDNDRFDDNIVNDKTDFLFFYKFH